jgi:hypothetical protein
LVVNYLRSAPALLRETVGATKKHLRLDNAFNVDQVGQSSFHAPGR